MAESPSPKPQFSSDYQEFETRDDAAYQKSVRTARLVESIRLGLTALALLAGITIVGTSADTLSVYNTTHLGEDYFLPLWPSDFDIRPTIALVTCGAIIFVTSAISIVVSKLPPVSISRHFTLLTFADTRVFRFGTTLSFMAPFHSSSQPSASSLVSSVPHSSTVLTPRRRTIPYKRGLANGPLST